MSDRNFKQFCSNTATDAVNEADICETVGVSVLPHASAV